jgi:hypothetical protein
MTKQQILDLMMTLSAIESWGFSSGQRMPDYLQEQLSDHVGALRAEILKSLPENHRPVYIE